MVLYLDLHWNMIPGMVHKVIGAVHFLAHYSSKGIQKLTGRRKGLVEKENNNFKLNRIGTTHDSGPDYFCSRASDSESDTGTRRKIGPC